VVVLLSSRRRGCKLAPSLAVLMLLPLQSAQAAGRAENLTVSNSPTLSLERRTELPGFKGDYDRIGADARLSALYIAAEDSDKVEVVDLKSNVHRASLDLPTPHYIATLPDTNELVVTHSGGDGRSVIINGETGQIVASVDHRPGANSMAYDAPRNRIYMVAGGKNRGEPDSSLLEIDPVSRRQTGELKFPVEKLQSLAVEQRGSRIFTNVTTLKQVAVVDKLSRTVKATWPLTVPGDNSLLALDERAGHLFVGVRRPDSLQVLDTNSGATIATLNLPGSCDSLIFDDLNGRLYALGGEGRIAVYRRNGGGQYEELPSVTSAPGGKTGLLVPSAGKLFVAVSPGDSGRSGAVLTFKVHN
jgi:DNA-binding beta-propeller fold protein YncE